MWCREFIHPLCWGWCFEHTAIVELQHSPTCSTVGVALSGWCFLESTIQRLQYLFVGGVVVGVIFTCGRDARGGRAATDFLLRLSRRWMFFKDYLITVSQGFAFRKNPRVAQVNIAQTLTVHRFLSYG